MKNMKRNISIFVFVAVGFALTQAYQNCAPLQVEGFTTMASELPHGMEEGTGNHPTGDQEKELPSRKQLVVPRTHVASLFREVFTSAKYPVANLEALIDKWVVNKGAQFGGACNLYSSYSTVDCSGSASNVNNPSYIEDSTVRESYRIQMCENVLGQDASINAALEKLGLLSSTEITMTTVKAAYGLFYRSNPAESAVLNTLLDLNKSLVEEKATLLNRWRATLTQICESPGWQLL